MARKDKDLSLPGNDGRWFLELAGVIESTPKPTATYTELKALEPPPATVASESEAVTAGAAAVSGSLASDSDDDAFVPVAHRSTDPLDQWQPDDVSPGLARRGVGRWILVFLLILFVAAGAAAVYFLPRAVQQEADLLAADYRIALTGLRNELPTSQAALSTLTDPTSPADAVSATVTAVGDLNTRASVVMSHATASPPPTIPFVPRDPLEALEPTRTTMLILGADAEGVSGRLAVTFAYRTTVPSLLSTPDLPTEADTAAIDALSVALAESLADTARLVAELPVDPTFAETRDLATQASERFAPWQLEYLDALRQGETDRSTALVAEHGQLRSGIESALVTDLTTVRAEVDPLIVELADETENAIAAIP
ncbi:MAG: hypothetical protein ABFR89_11115 [Actinomycetota bacterium]